MKKLIAKLAGWYLNVLAYIWPSKAGHVGMLLFCRPFRTPMKNYQKEFLQTADQFSFEHDGVTVQAYRWGTGEKNILFIHGWESHSFRWKAYIDAFPKDEYTLYAMDAPGHGLSGGNFLSVPYYSAAIQQLVASIGNLHAIVSHSVGSFAILHAFYEHPLPVSRLVITAPPGDANDFVMFYQKTLGLSDKALALVNKRFVEIFGKPISFYSTVRFAEYVNVPGIIIHDEGDLETPYRHAKAIHAKWPQSNLITTQGLGHNLKSKAVVRTVFDYTEHNTNEILTTVG